MNRLTLSVFIFFALISNTYAMEALRFQEAKTYKQKQIISFVKEQDSSKNLVLAPIDLNNDAIDEYVVRPKNLNSCPKAPFCSYKIIAFKQRTPILIGSFDAHKILITDKKTYGIRDIIVYNQRYNDFIQKTAIWDPFSFRYQIF